MHFQFTSSLQLFHVTSLNWSGSSSQSQSHIATDGQSVSLGVEPHLGPMTRYLLLFDSWQLQSWFCGAPSLTRGRVSLLYMPLALASTVFRESESLETRDHILLSQIWDFPFRRLLRLAGSRWRYSTPPPHGLNWITEQSRAVPYCRQPASTVTPGIELRWDPWPYICSVSRLVFSSFVVPPLIKMEGLGFFIIGVPLLHLIPPDVTLK
jgi:hypothetical protein